MTSADEYLYVYNLDTVFAPFSNNTGWFSLHYFSKTGKDLLHQLMGPCMFTTWTLRLHPSQTTQVGFLFITLVKPERIYYISWWVLVCVQPGHYWRRRLHCSQTTQVGFLLSILVKPERIYYISWWVLVCVQPGHWDCTLLKQHRLVFSSLF